MIGGATFSALVFPCVTLICFIFVDIIECWERSTNAIPLTSMVFYGIIWAFNSVICCYHGSTYGYRADPVPTHHGNIKVSLVKRSVPPQPFYLNLWVAMPIAGVIIFASIFVEFQYIWTSMWRSQLYGMFGTLFGVFSLLVFIVSEIGIVFTYLTLRAGNYNWQWRSFLIGASGGICIGLYMDYYFFFVANIELFAAELIYYIWSILVSFSLVIMCGMVSFLASFGFVKTMFE